jgi:hypothetical protein
VGATTRAINLGDTRASSGRARITMGKDKQTMALENDDNEPVRLTDVRVEK